MKRQINYTDRKKIPKKNVELEFFYNDGIPSKARITKLSLEELGLPSEAKVFLDAYHRTEFKRFPLGTLNKLEIPKDLDFDGLILKQRLLFRVIVSDPKTKKVLAHADRIKPSNLSKGDDVFQKRESILPVYIGNIDPRAWMLKFDSEYDDGPVLLVNNKIPDTEKFCKSPEFVQLVLPAVLKEILFKMLIIDRIDSFEDPTYEWHKKWLTFLKQQLRIDPEEHFSAEADSNEIADQIEEVVNRFAEKQKEYFEKLISIRKET